MEISDKRIDDGKAFDWGKTSKEYAKFRDIYPEEFYKKIVDRGLCLKGQKVLDLGTGTGVVPRNMYKYGAHWTGTDISPEQIEQAKLLAADGNMKIDFIAAATEELVEKAGFQKESFDVITACQCFWYFNHEKVMPVLADLLKPKGKLVILYMAWLPDEDKIAGKSEEMILKYSQKWSGCGAKRQENWVPDIAYKYFEKIDHEEYDIMVPFTKESWHGRVRASRGIGASLNPEELANWDTEHRALLDEIAPEKFDILHYGAITVLQNK